MRKTLPALAILVGAAFPVAAQAPQAQRAQVDCSAAKVCERPERFACRSVAAEACQSVVDAPATTPATRIAAARTLVSILPDPATGTFMSGGEPQIDRKVAAYKKLLELSPNDMGVRLGFAEFLYEHGTHHQKDGAVHAAAAVEFLDAYIASQGGKLSGRRLAEIHLKRAFVYERGGEKDKQIEALKAAVAADGNYPDARNALAKYYGSSNFSADQSEGLKQADIMVQRNGGDWRVWQARGKLHDDLDNDDKALSDYQKAYDLLKPLRILFITDPSHPIGRATQGEVLANLVMARGKIFEKREAWDKAIAEYERLKQHSQETALGKLFAIHLARKSFDPALKVATEGINTKSSYSSEWLVKRAEIFEAQGQPQKAIADFETAIKSVLSRGPTPKAPRPNAPAPSGPTTGKSVDHEMITAIQKELARVGCSSGAEDGTWGGGVKRAIDRYNRFMGRQLSADRPLPATLEALRARSGVSCLPQCPPELEHVAHELEDRCVPKRIRPAPVALGAEQIRQLEPLLRSILKINTAQNDTPAKLVTLGRLIEIIPHAAAYRLERAEYYMSQQDYAEALLDLDLVVKVSASTNAKRWREEAMEKLGRKDPPPPPHWSVAKPK